MNTDLIIMFFNKIVEIISKYFILSQQSIRNIVVIEVVLFLFSIARLLQTRQIKKWICFFGLYSYLFLILVSTVMTRINWEVWNIQPDNVGSVCWLPFYSYLKIMQGNNLYIQEVIMNCVMLIPVGFILPIICKKGSIGRCVATCFAISVSIEGLQLLYSCGTCEIDDLLHNTVGGFFGYICNRGFMKVCNLLNNRKKIVYE